MSNGILVSFMNSSCVIANCGGFALLLLTMAVPAFARIVLYRDAQSTIQLIEAETVQINGRNEVRIVGPTFKQVEDPRKLPSVKMASSGLLLYHHGPNAMAEFDNVRGLRYLIPDGTPKQSVRGSGAIWQTVAVTCRRSKSDKAGIDLNPAQVVAVLPTHPGSFAAFCLNRQAAVAIAGDRGALTLQLEVLKAFTQTFPAAPDIEQIQKFTLEEMNRALSRFDSGIGDVAALLLGLEAAQFSDIVAETNAEQRKLREAIRQRKGVLDQQIATLWALADGAQWAAFLAAWRPFERTQWAFPDLTAVHKKALESFVAEHSRAARRRLDAGEYRQACSEYRLAIQRQPRDPILRRDRFSACTEFSLREARARQATLRTLTPTQREALAQYLALADQYVIEKRFDEAARSVHGAEEIDPSNVNVLLKKAHVLGARNEFVKALEMLEQIDLVAVDENRASVRQLRGEFYARLDRARLEGLAEVRSLLNEYAFHKAHRKTIELLRMDPEDPDFLYEAALTAFYTRRREDGIGFLRRYLDVPDTLDTNWEQRRKVYGLLDRIPAPLNNGQGVPSWASSRPLGTGVFYCPVSLAFQPRVDTITTDKNLTLRFEWDREKLKSATHVSEKDYAANERPFHFSYDPVHRFIRIISTEKVAERPPGLRGAAGRASFGFRGPTSRTQEADPDEALQNSNVIFGNSPYVDVEMIHLLTGNTVAVGFAGNRFFHPFIWERPYFFELHYDPQGRVRTAREITDPDAPTKTVSDEREVEFLWSDDRLKSVRVFALKDSVRASAPIYERTLQYNGDRLMSEQIRGPKGQSKIDYDYEGRRLTRAHCSKDANHDDRSRDVVFRP